MIRLKVFLKDNKIIAFTTKKKIFKKYREIRDAEYDKIIDIHEEDANEIFKVDAYNSDKEISMYPIRSYNEEKEKWITIYVPLTLSEVECVRATIQNIETTLMKYAWIPSGIFKKKVSKALSVIGYSYYNKLVHGSKVKQEKCSVDDYKVLKEYFYIKGGY